MKNIKDELTVEIAILRNKAEKALKERDDILRRVEEIDLALAAVDRNGWVLDWAKRPMGYL